MNKKIGINLLGVLPNIGGAYNYVKNFLDLISQFDSDNTYAIFVSSNNSDFKVDEQKFEKILCNVNTNNRFKRVFYENFVLPIVCLKSKIDFMIWPIDTIAFFTTTKNMVISHDFLPLINPNQFSFIKRNYLKTILKYTIKKADFFFFISKTTELEFKKINLRKKYKSVILPNSINLHFNHDINIEKVECFKLKFNLKSPFWLYVAHNYPHKNHKNLILAFSLFKNATKNELKLVLRGDNLDIDEELLSIISKLQLNESIIFLPKLTFEDLPLLYKGATALVFPSLYEGGGIPLMEAQACGCPILASNIPAVNEFCENSSYLFDPKSIESISETMLLFSMIDSATKKNKIEAGIENTKSLRPDFLFNRILNAYQDLQEG